MPARHAAQGLQCERQAGTGYPGTPARSRARGHAALGRMDQRQDDGMRTPERAGPLVELHPAATLTRAALRGRLLAW